MREQYLNWIAGLDLSPSQAYGMCEKISKLMLKVFPELILIRGHYICIHRGSIEHWWLVDIFGNIIDPTVNQFLSLGNGMYIPWDDSKKEPTGKCPNCGNYSYDSNYCCSDKCATEYLKYLNN